MPGLWGNRRALVAWLALAAIAAGAAPTDRAAAEPGSRSVALATLRGVVERVRDGDTFELEGRAIRLQGVAAPELNDRLGAESREALRQLVAGRTVACAPDGSRTRGRIVAVCTVDGRDLGAALVAAGLARDCPRFSGGRYAALERAASARGAPITRVYPLPSYCRPDR
ncbi:MAG: thermonuclease family protein [Geminicoccaceae bacterium]|nr:thermonuclease family protein [Geminicoccaceae bacterium]